MLPISDVVRIVHDWRLPAPPIVAVYSNLPTVELFLNGNSLGKKKMAWAAWVQWEPAFEPGTLTAVGYDANGVARVSSLSDPRLQSCFLSSLPA